LRPGGSRSSCWSSGTSRYVYWCLPLRWSDCGQCGRHLRGNRSSRWRGCWCRYIYRCLPLRWTGRGCGCGCGCRRSCGWHDRLRSVCPRILNRHTRWGRWHGTCPLGWCILPSTSRHSKLRIHSLLSSHQQPLFVPLRTRTRLPSRATEVTKFGSASARHVEAP